MRVRVWMLGLMLVAFGCADGSEEQAAADLVSEENDEDAEAEEDVEDEPDTVSFDFPVYLTGSGPHCDAPLDMPWCHFANVDGSPEDSAVQGETECQAKRFGPLSHIGVGYSVTLLDASGSIVAVSEFEERDGFEFGIGRVRWTPSGQSGCRIEVAFTDVPSSAFYTVRTEDGETDFSLDDALSPDETDPGAWLEIAGS